MSEQRNAIDRQSVVRRHNVVLSGIDALSPLSVGNGEFAFSADITGLQTFPDTYADGIPLCTQSQWGWHSFPHAADLHPEQIRYKDYDTYGRPVPYLTDSSGQEAKFNWLRENPHRLHLGRVALIMQKADGSAVGAGDLKSIRQELDLWTGTITSRFEVDGSPVTVETCCAGGIDALAVRIRSRLAENGRLRVLIAFPYGSPQASAADWDSADAHQTKVTRSSANRVDIARQLDADRYFVSLNLADGVRFEQEQQHRLVISAEPGSDRIEFVCAFSPAAIDDVPTVDAARTASKDFWQKYWTSGGAIDLDGSSDSRAPELERRIVLSQYLMAVNCSGSLPPAETGITCNSWYGKFHLEMHWWHGVHFALWGRLPLLEKSLDYYHRILPKAREIAQRQGYRGVRWPKMVGPDGQDSPSPVGPLLIWQQPHPIYYAELCYRQDPSKKALDHWGQIVQESADFLASFAVKDPASGNKYMIGPPLKTVSENTEQRTTRNPSFELTYVRWALMTGQEWRQRLGQPRDPHWDDVLNNLAPLAQADGVYLMQEGMTDTYTQWNWEHPALLGMRGMLSGPGVDPEMMRRTVEKAMSVWQWDRCWGWDFPLVAMSAARNARPDLAIDAFFLKSVKNNYSAAGHNYQRPNLTLYLPGNGGVLSAIAMMAAGWDGGPDTHAPGFPKDGWTVKWEGLRRMI